MALAEVEDVKRVLRALNQDIDVYLLPKLEAAEEFVREHTGRNFDATGSVTEKFFNARQDGLLYLSDAAPSAVQVRVFGSASIMVGSLLTENDGYQVLNRGLVQLLWYSGGYDPRYATFGESQFPGAYERVEVTYTASGVVPKPVKEATALIAAAAYRQEEAQTGGYTSERLGDYSYSRDAKDIGVPPMALRYLEPYCKAAAPATT